MARVVRSSVAEHWHGKPRSGVRFTEAPPFFRALSLKLLKLKPADSIIMAMQADWGL